MKRYEALKSMVINSQNKFVPPKGNDIVGFGNSVFMLSPTKKSCDDTLKSGFFDYRLGMYKYYLIDFIYNEKIGFKKYLKNNTGIFKKEFAEIEFPTPIRMVTNGNKMSVIKKRSNLVVNFGEWNDVYFQYQVKSSLEKICRSYLEFISKKINDDNYDDFDKVLFIDVDQWFSSQKRLGLDKKSLNNPVSILLITLYKFPELMYLINGCDIVFVNSANYKILRIAFNDLHGKNYSKIKNRIIGLVNQSCIDLENVDEKVIDQEYANVITDASLTNNSVNTRVNDKKIKEEMVRKEIISALTKSLLGNVEDITSDEDTSEINTDSDKINEIKNLANNYIDNHMDLLSDTNIDIAIDEVKKEVKKKYYVREFTPKYSDEKLEEIQKLSKVQDSVIGDMQESLLDMESKIINESDFSSIVSSKNTNVTHSKFKNFDKSYNEKKLAKDIDNSIGQLANAAVKVFVVDKQEKDTSTPLDLKKTITYKLMDENGNEMTIKLDVPIIFDDHYMMIKGNKKVIQHTLILNPIVKTGNDTVQLVTNYNKMFITRKGSIDVKTNALFKFINSHKDTFSVINGNGAATNADRKSTLEYNAFAKKIIQFSVNENLIILDQTDLFKKMDKLKINYSKIDLNTNIIIGIDTYKNKPLVMKLTDSFVDMIMSYMDENDVEKINKIGAGSNGGTSLTYTRAKILSKNVPLILLLLYFEGFSTVMKKAGIEYELVSKTEDDDNLDIDLSQWGLTELADGYIKWKRYPTENSLLMNGLNGLPTHLYYMDELESKDTYVYLLTNIYAYANQANNIDQYYDFMIDPITKEVLTDKKLPTDLVSLMLLANKMLKTDDHTFESDLANMRLRSNEILAYHTYKAITDAYNVYRHSQHKRVPTPITIRQDAIIKRMSSQAASAMNDASTLNPVLEICKLRAVTYKGESGTNQEHSFNLKVRAYNETMLGVLGITSSNDSNIGINRQLTLEPNITSTRGYIDVAKKANVEELNSANLLSPSELLTPLGIQHDDPARTCMTYKQSIGMLMSDISDPVLVGNGVEKVLPYHLSSEFTVVAEDSGEIVDKNDNFVVIKYRNGKYRTIDTSIQIKKNASHGFYIETKLVCNKNVGDKVQKNEVVAWDEKAYSKFGNDPEVCMNLGPLVKIAIIPEWDIYEDSAPITAAASEKMSTTMVMPVEVTLNKDAYVSRMLQIGDKVQAGEPVIVFDNYHEDEDVMALINLLRDSEQEDIVESNSTTKKSHYTGTIVDIKILSTVELDELSDSLKEIVGDYWNQIKRNHKFLDKYSNSDDLKYYKSGNVITNTPKPIARDNQGKVKGKKMDDGVIITFYVAFKDIMKKGDKLAAEFALKSITSHVIDNGLEPYSEYRPEETIDMITAPLSISARKTPSIFLAMFSNKLMIEAKRHLRDYWFND